MPNPTQFIRTKEEQRHLYHLNRGNKNMTGRVGMTGKAWTGRGILLDCEKVKNEPLRFFPYHLDLRKQEC